LILLVKLGDTAPSLQPHYTAFGVPHEKWTQG
jgi:hypothetical protein